MVENTQIEISTNLKNDLEKKAKANNTDIDNIIKLLMIENEDLKKNPSNYYDKTLISAKDNKNKKGEVTSTSYSTAIPKPILNKLGLQKGQVLYWDIDQYKIIITPELIPKATPEEESIQAGNEILTELFNFGNPVNETYQKWILPILKSTEFDKDTKIKKLLKYKDKYLFKELITYLLDYPLYNLDEPVPDQYEIVQTVYEEITKTD